MGFPDVLQSTTVPIISNTTAAATHNFKITDDQLAAAWLGTGGHNACFGDSGGPLTVPNADGTGVLLAGTVSWGQQGCANGVFPNMYGRVSSFAEWIQEQVTIPSVFLQTPQALEYVGGQVPIRVDALAAPRLIERVRLEFPDGTSAELTEAPYVYLWDSTKVDDGFRAIAVQAFDEDGNSNRVHVGVFVANAQSCEPPPQDDAPNPHLWSMGFGGHAEEGDIDVAIDPDGHVVVAGCL